MAPFFQSKKFDDLCTNFIHHAELDDSDSLITVTKSAGDKITGMALSNTGSVGVIPVTIPTSMVNDVSVLFQTYFYICSNHCRYFMWTEKSILLILFFSQAVINVR